MEIIAKEKKLQLIIVFFITLNSQEVAGKLNKIQPSKSAVKWILHSLSGHAEITGYLQWQTVLKRIKREIIENVQDQNPRLPCLGSFKTIGQKLRWLFGTEIHQV